MQGEEGEHVKVGVSESEIRVVRNCEGGFYTSSKYYWIKF